MSSRNGRNKLDSKLADAPKLLTVAPGSGLSNKMADDFSGGIHPLSDFISVPIHLLEPFSGKRDSDFSRNPATHAQMVSSIREHGVLEPLTIRKKDARKFEILAGETRWLAAKEAGETELPCRLVAADDANARMIFATTNLVRRDLTVRDRINGWWMLYTSLKESGKLQAFRANANDPEFADIVVTEGAGNIAFRQIQRYVKCHDLISEWIDRLEQDALTFMTAYRIAFFPAEVQAMLLQYPVEEKKLAGLLKIFEGRLPGVAWEGERTIEAVLGGRLQVVDPGKTPVPESAKRAFSRSTKIMVCKAVLSEIRDSDFDNAEAVVRRALKMYYDMQDKMKAE